MNKTVVILSFIVASRFFALFIVLPVISLYAQHLTGASALSSGLIVGIYAIFQMVFSLPFGLLSDIIGRKMAMLLGLVIFIIGSLICAQAASIDAMLLGRSLQGAGAIGGVASAMIADNTSEHERAKAMAIMGAAIGLSFAAAMIIGPALAHFAGLASLFYLSAALSLLAILLLAALPNSTPCAAKPDKLGIKRVIFNKNLAILYLTNFLQKMIMSGFFMLIPLVFTQIFAQDASLLYKLYAAAMALGFFAMGFGGVFGERRGKSKHILLCGVLLFGISAALFGISASQAASGGIWLFYAALGCFFVGFCLHEPIMQSSLSKICPIHLKGSVLGLSNSCGYFGSFLGPLCAAICLHAGVLGYFFASICALCALWFCLLFWLENPNDFRRIYLGFGKDISALRVADSGQDERGVWVKINTKKYPLSLIAKQLGLELSGASEYEKGRKND